MNEAKKHKRSVCRGEALTGSSLRLQLTNAITSSSCLPGHATTKTARAAEVRKGMTVFSGAACQRRANATGEHTEKRLDVDQMRTVSEPKASSDGPAGPPGRLASGTITCAKRF